MKDPNLIVIKKSKFKELIGRFFAFIIKGYLEINKLSTIWRVIFSSESRIRILLSSDAIVLFLNTLLFAFVGNFFRGLIGEVAIVVAFLNILAFLVIKMEWTDKLLNKK
jgi:hypothetical protein